VGKEKSEGRDTRKKDSPEMRPTPRTVKQKESNAERGPEEGMKGGGPTPTGSGDRKKMGGIGTGVGFKGSEGQKVSGEKKEAPKRIRENFKKKREGGGELNPNRGEELIYVSKINHGFPNLPGHEWTSEKGGKGG